jgi:hypothetical protein
VKARVSVHAASDLIAIATYVEPGRSSAAQSKPAAPSCTMSIARAKQNGCYWVPQCPYERQRPRFSQQGVSGRRDA